ncbi:MAG: rSAM/selenodomain-associated transferase 1, partial [Candidatus Arcticimaribacter sp.]
EVAVKAVLLKICFMDKKLLLIFAKNPVLSKVKTRLAASIGDEKALFIYKKLLQKTAETIEGLDLHKSLYYSEYIEEGDVWEGNVSDKNIQVGNTLGEKMENAFKRGFSEGFLEIVIIGTDLWDIEMKDINLAFKALESNAGVIGPATDGGYYLLGLSEWTTEVFENKKWGTSSVLKDTMQSFKNKKVVKLDYKNDIDNYTDLCSFPKLLKLLDT